jgi:opacity protein-like surface antigen
MTITMKHKLNTVMGTARRTLGLAAGALMVATAAGAQNAQSTQGLEDGASTGGYVPFFADRVRRHARHALEAGPAFTRRAIPVAPVASIYANGMLAFGAIRRGSAIQPAVVGPSSQVMLTSGTAGLFLSTADLLGEHLQPTLRLGGGFKYYSLDLTGAESQLRPTADLGVGLRGIGVGPIDVTAEVRYLLSSFDQSKLPIRGITPQDQRQNDVVFSIGVGIRP